MIKVTSRFIEKKIGVINNEKGMSAVEMMVAVAIAGIIMGAVAAFLTAHIRSFETTIDVIDVQYEGQLAFNQMGKLAMESKGVAYLYGDDGGGTAVDLLSTRNEAINPVAIAFDDWEGYRYVFHYDDTNNKLVYKRILSADTVVIDYSTTPSNWYDFAFNIESWSFKTGVSGANYRETDNIYIYMDFVDGDVSLNLSNHFKFRNAEMP